MTALVWRYDLVGLGARVAIAAIAISLMVAGHAP